LLKQKYPPVPRTVHDVGDLVGFCDFAGCTNKRHKVVIDNGSSGDTSQDLGRNKTHHEMDMNQHTTTYRSIFNEDERWCLESAQHVGSVKTSKLPTDDVHPSVQPAPDPSKIYLHLSPLGAESTSTHISNFSFDLYSDAVDQDPNVQRFSSTVHCSDSMPGFRAKVVSTVMDRKYKPVEWLVFWKIAHEAPNYLHEHNDVSTYNETPNNIPRENKEYTVCFVGFVSHDHGEPQTMLFLFTTASMKYLDCILQGPHHHFPSRKFQRLSSVILAYISRRFGFI
jgi:hypothetical protein